MDVLAPPVDEESPEVPVVTLSPDGKSRWSGTAWESVDGKSRWSGTGWESVVTPEALGAAAATRALPAGSLAHDGTTAVALGESSPAVAAQREAVRARLLTLRLARHNPAMLERVLTDIVMALEIRGVAWSSLPDKEQGDTIQIAINQDVERHIEELREADLAYIREHHESPLWLQELGADSARVEAAKPRASAADEFACPLGAHVDMVQKVSSVYQAGVTETNLQGKASMTTSTFGQEEWGVGVGSGPVNLSGRTVTMLASQLAPPIPPVRHGAWGCGSVLLLLGALFFVIAFAAAFVSALVTPATAGSGPKNGISFFLGMLFVALILEAAPVTFLVGLVLIKRHTSRTGRRVYAAALRRYSVANTLWGRLYYCARHGGVFWPTGVSFNPDVKASPARMIPIPWTDGLLMPIDEYLGRLWQVADIGVEMIDPTTWIGAAAVLSPLSQGTKLRAPQR